VVCIRTENQSQGDFYPFVLHELPLEHLRYGLTDVPPQRNYPPDSVFNLAGQRPGIQVSWRNRRCCRVP